MISLDIAIAVLALFAALNYRLHRSVLYPPFVFGSMWLLDLALYRSNLIVINPIHTDTLVIVVAGIAAFSIGGLLASLMPSALFQIHFLGQPNARSVELWRKILTTIILCSLPFFFLQMVQAAASGTGTTLLMRARSTEIDAVDSGNVQWSLLGYLQLFSLYLPLLFAVDKRDWRFWAVTLTAMIVAVLSTGRTDLLLLIGGISTVYLLRTGRHSFLQASRFLRLPIAVFMCLYIGLIFTNKNTEELGVQIEGGAAGIATFLVISYVVGPLAAFDGVVQNPGEYALLSSHIFEFPLKLADSLHLLPYLPASGGKGFVLVPFPTNVYTIFNFYYLELGVAGTMAAFFLFGLFHSALYMKAKAGSRFSTYLFGYLMYTLILSIFDDAYYLLGALLRAAIFGLLYFSLAQTSFRLLPSRKAQSNASPTPGLPQAG